MKATATTSGTTCVVRAQDFSDSVKDATRHEWTAGKLRHVIAALEGTPVIITTDRQTGHTLVNVTLVGIRESFSGQTQLGIHSEFSDGTSSTIWHLAFMLGDTIVPLTNGNAKWAAKDTFRDERSFAVELAQAEHGEIEGRAWGKWSACPGRYGVSVRYEPHTDNPHFANKQGERGWWTYSLDAVQRQGRVRQNRMHELYPDRYPAVTV